VPTVIVLLYASGSSSRFGNGISQGHPHALIRGRMTQSVWQIKNRQSESEVGMAEPTYEELKARLSQLEKEVETKKRSGDLIFKVGEKGGVSVYGLGRFPVTLYYEQWQRLLGASDDLKAFLEENKSKLKLKE
jgi:hypothetical protein